MEMKFKIQLLILSVIIDIGLGQAVVTANLAKPQFSSSKLSGPDLHGHSFKRDAKDQTAVEDKTGQSNQNVYYQQSQHHPQQPQQEQQQQYQTGFVPFGQYFSQAAISPQVQYKEDYDVQYLKGENGVELSNYGYQNQADAYQTLAYSANHPSHAKLASIIQLMTQQLAPIQYAYEPLAPQQQQQQQQPQSYEQPKTQNIALAYPSGYRQAHSMFAPAPVANPSPRFAYPAHALQYTIVTPGANTKSNAYPGPVSQSQSTKLILSPSQFSKYQFAQPQQQPSPNVGQYLSNLIYSNPPTPNVQLYHPLIASQYDSDEKPQVYFNNPSKSAYPGPSNFQYKQVSPQLNNHVGPISFNRFSAHLPRNSASSGPPKNSSPETPIMYTPPSPNVQKQQLADNSASSGKIVYTYGSHLLHPSDNKVTLHQSQPPHH